MAQDGSRIRHPEDRRQIGIKHREYKLRIRIKHPER